MVVGALDLNRLAIGIRPREPWEAIDLGFLMANRWWWPLMRLWLLISAPLFVVLAFLPAEWLWLQYTVVWWLKPIFERALLDFLSRAVFGETPSTGELLRNFPRIAIKQLFLSLTWRRLSPSRAFDLPVMQLEGLSGERRHARLMVLHRQGVGPAASTTMFGASIEFFLAFALASMAYVFLPQEVELSWDMLDGDFASYWAVLIINTLTYIAMTVVAPYYVAGGFSLYLNRRIHLEAWDIEIAFKKIVQKRNRQASIALLVMAGFLAASMSLTPPPVMANENSAGNFSPEASQRLINEIKRSDAFNRRETVVARELPWDWLNPDNDDEDKKEEQADILWLESLRNFFAGVAAIAEWLLWILVIALIVFVALRYGHWLRDLVGMAPALLPDKQKPRVLFGMDVQEDSLPDDVGKKAVALWRSGDTRQALSLLYRACLVQLIQRGSPLRDGDTEGRCVQKAERALNDGLLELSALEYFRELTSVWQRLAYAHHLPEDEQALRLCQQWNTAWQVNQSDAARA